MRRLVALILLNLIATAHGACGGSLPGQSDSASTATSIGSAASSAPDARVLLPEPAEQPVSVVELIDFSASPDPAARNASLALARTLIAEARPGDRVQLRLIGAKSYSPDMVVADLRLPVYERRSAYEVNLGAERAYAAQIDSVRRTALRGVDAVAQRRLYGSTDEWDAIAAARDAILHDSAARVVILTGDGADTRGDTLNMDLRTIRVVLMLSTGIGGRASDVYTRRLYWTRALTSLGASAVEAHVPGEPLGLDALRPSAPGTPQH